MLLSTSIFFSTLRRRISLRHLHAPPQLTYPLSHPIYTIWASNTSLGKTLLSTGLSISFLLSPSPSPSPKKFIYLKPIQTGFPLDSDSRFVFEKFSQFFLLTPPPFSASASNTVLKTSIPASKSILGTNDYRLNAKGMVDLEYFEERRLEGGSNIMSAELACKTMYGWKEAVSPHLAAEREEAVVEDGEVLEMLSRCLFVDSREEDVDVMCVVETAGGVASPGPSGSLQCDLFRYE